MITKKNLPMRAIFFRDHEISGLRPAAAPCSGRFSHIRVGSYGEAVKR
jgi:hypothetical protein